MTVEIPADVSIGLAGAWGMSGLSAIAAWRLTTTAFDRSSLRWLEIGT